LEVEVEIKITYARAMEFCPVQACEAIAKLQASRSKFRKADPATLPWTFFWGIEVRSETFADIFSGRSAKRDEAERKRTLEKRLEDHKKAITVSVCVKGYGASLPRGTVPDEILAIELPGVRKQYDEEKRAEEREAEVNALLKQLGGGGLAIFSMSPPP
jgi:hypothetical protein